MCCVGHVYFFFCTKTTAAFLLLTQNVCKHFFFFFFQINQVLITELFAYKKYARLHMHYTHRLYDYATFCSRMHLRSGNSAHAHFVTPVRLITLIRVFTVPVWRPVAICLTLFS